VTESGSFQERQDVLRWTPNDRHAVVDEHRSLHASRVCQNELGPTFNRADVTVRTLREVFSADAVGVNGNRIRILGLDAFLEVTDHIGEAALLFEQRQRLTRFGAPWVVVKPHAITASARFVRSIFVVGVVPVDVPTVGENLRGFVLIDIVGDGDLEGVASRVGVERVLVEVSHAG
jgi:hypothetical protein